MGPALAVEETILKKHLSDIWESTHVAHRIVKPSVGKVIIISNDLDRILDSTPVQIRHHSHTSMGQGLGWGLVGWSWDPCARHGSALYRRTRQEAGHGPYSCVLMLSYLC